MHRRLAIGILVAAVAAACGGGVVSPSQNKTDTFNGTLQPVSSGNANIGLHQVNITKTGELSVIVTSLTPSVPGDTYFAVGIGQLFGALTVSNCNPIQINQFAVPVNPAINSLPITPGTYCIFIYDEGLFTVAEDYALTVSHP